MLQEVFLSKLGASVTSVMIHNSLKLIKVVVKPLKKGDIWMKALLSYGSCRKILAKTSGNSKMMKKSE